jgi:hypothetical protein
VVDKITVGRMATLLTTATLAPFAISLWKQEKPKYIIPMVVFMLMEIVVFFL